LNNITSGTARIKTGGFVTAELPHKWNYQNQKCTFAVEIQPKWNHGNHMSQVEQPQSKVKFPHRRTPRSYARGAPPILYVPMFPWKYFFSMKQEKSKEIKESCLGKAEVSVLAFS
jgi:hypothetical protein